VAGRLPLAKLHAIIPAIWVLILFAVSLWALVAAWRRFDGKGTPRRRTIPAFIGVGVVWLIVYPKLMVRG
jgi:hypothetical protein